MSVPYDLSCWYLNARRIAELTGSNAITHSLFASGASDTHFQRLAELEAIKNAAVTWLRAANPSPLGMLLAEDQLAEGSLFTHNSNFYFKGLPAIREAIDRNKPVGMALAHSKLKPWLPESRLSMPFHHDHLTSNSSWVQLSGQKRVFVLGLVTEIKGSEIKAVPYVIANIVHNTSELWSREQLYWNNHLEVHVDQIDNFQEVRNIDIELTKKSLNKLKDISEEDVKKAFAKIIGEPHVPRDWGGEASDLFSTYVTLDGKRISTAFALKGPSKFKPMRMAELGKNGDQISRLFSEPADLYVLQHCHKITPDVRATMRAFSQRMGNPSLFCIIDGYDTVRILEAYRKCGLGETNIRKNSGSSGPNQ